MAHDYPFAPPGYAGNGHPIHNNRNRGYNKGRGGRGGRSHNSGNYGPRAVPAPITIPGPDAIAPMQFVPDPLAPWGQKYGRYTSGQSPQFFMPLSSGPLLQPAYPYAAYSEVQPRAISNPSAMHTGTPAYPTIVTPHIPTPTDTTMSSWPPAKGNAKLDNFKTTGSRPGANNTKATTLDALHIHAPVPKRIHKLTPKNRHVPGSTPSLSSVLREFVPNEGGDSIMDATEDTADATVKLLDHESLMQLQVFNITLAHKLQQKLAEAKKIRELQEATFLKKRGVLLSLLTVARDSEREHVKTVQRIEERFHNKLQEAFKLDDSDAKTSAQIAATTQLKAAPEFSRMAAEQREKIDDYRNELNELDNSRANSRNVYSNTIHNVLVQALGGKAVAQNLGATASGPSQANAKEKKTSTNLAPAQDDRKDSAQMAQLNKEQPVFERQPETEHQSIGEVLHRTTHHDSSKTSTAISPKSHFAVPATSQQPTEQLEAFPDFWVPEKIRGQAPIDGSANFTGQEEPKNSDAIKKQEPSTNHTFESKAENKTPVSQKIRGNDKQSKAQAAPKTQPGQPGTEGAGRVRKKNAYKKKGGNAGSGGGSSAGPGGPGPDTPPRGIANALPKSGPPTTDMRKGG